MANRSSCQPRIALLAGLIHIRIALLRHFRNNSQSEKKRICCIWVRFNPATNKAKNKASWNCARLISESFVLRGGDDDVYVTLACLHNLRVLCLSGAAGQRGRRCTRLVAWGALCGGGGGGGGRGAAGGRGGGGSWAARSMSGRNSHKNSNKCPVGY